MRTLPIILITAITSIMVTLTLVAASHGQGRELPKLVLADPQVDVRPKDVVYAVPNIGPWIEQHCVAVLTEAHVEKVTRGSIGFDPPQEVDKDGNVPEQTLKMNGNEIRHVPEQTLKLRCK